MAAIPSDDHGALAGLSGQTLSVALPLGGVILGGCRLFLGACRARRDLPSGHAMPQFILLACMLLAVCVMYGFIGAGLVKYALVRDLDLDFIPHNTALVAGLINGLSSGLSAVSIGVFAGKVVGFGSRQPCLFTVYLLVLVLLEAIALNGLLVSLLAVTRAHTSLTDMTTQTVLPFASVSALANLGGLMGSVASGVAVMEVGVAKPWLLLRCMVPVGFSGVTGICGLLTTMVDMQKWPPKGDDTVVGLLYLSSGAALAYVGYHSVKAIGAEEQSQLKMVVKLINCQAIGFAGLIYGLYLRVKRGNLMELLVTTTTPPPTFHMPWEAGALVLATGSFVFVLLLGSCCRPRLRPAKSTPLLAQP